MTPRTVRPKVRVVSRALWVLVVVSLLGLGHLAGAPSAAAQSGVVINEVVATNDSITAPIWGGTPDWIELQNNGAAIDLSGWTIADTDGVWTFPSVSLGAGDRLIVWASGLNTTAGGLHTNFKISAETGEPLTLANAAGSIVDTLNVPPLGVDQSYGRSANGDIGYLSQATFDAPNGSAGSGTVQFLTPPKTFAGSLNVEISGSGTIRYTTNGAAVTTESPALTGSLVLTDTAVVRAAGEVNGVLGPEIAGTFVKIGSEMVNRTSDIPIVLIHADGTIGENNGAANALRPAQAVVIDRTDNGTASPTSPVDYIGPAGLRIRGESSTRPDFIKKQYRFDLWTGPDQSTAQADLLGLGEDGDWTLYAPGHFDRAIVTNPFMYELAKRVGVSAPDWQFVELYVSTDQTKSIKPADYAGLYILRETVKIDKNRVDVSETEGFIVAYDWDDECCVNIENHPTWYPQRGDSRIAISSPNASKLTSTHEAQIRGVWSQLQSAAESGDFATLNSMIDWDSFLSHWILEILAKDADMLVASHFTHQDSDGLLRGGPVWDYDRALGGADDINNRLSEADGWDYASEGVVGGHAYDSDIYAGLWDIPQVQALLRGKWIQLRLGALSNSSMEDLIYDLGAQIAGEPLDREYSKFGSSVSGYGPRNICVSTGQLSTGGCSTRRDHEGELLHLARWVQTRADWLDGQWLGGSPPSVSNPGTTTIDELQSIDFQLQATDNQTIVFDVTGLPAGLEASLDGRISGTVAYGDGGTYPITVAVSDSGGSSTTMEFTLEVTSPFTGSPAVVLNEYNAVAPGVLLADQGSDATLGSIGGNGGDWFELVIVEDGVDMRGWSFELWSNDPDGNMTRNATLELKNNKRLSAMQAGSILTVAESQPEDLSYDPRQGDFTLNLQANDAGSGKLWRTQSDFDTNNKKWRLVVRDGDGVVRAQIAGETEPWDDANLGVSDREVMSLQVDPSQNVDVITDYNDSTSSTFGQANVLPDGSTQSFAALRGTFDPQGDVNCDGAMNIADAYSVARYAVELDDDSGWCATATADGVDAWAGDITQDGVTNILDASVIARCVVGLADPNCP